MSPTSPYFLKYLSKSSIVVLYVKLSTLRLAIPLISGGPLDPSYLLIFLFGTPPLQLNYNYIKRTMNIFGREKEKKPTVQVSHTMQN